MKNLLFSLSIIVLFVCNGFGQSTPEIKQSYDKFKDSTSLSTRVGVFSPSGGVSSWMLQAEFTGEKAVNPRIFLMLLSVSDNWKFLKRDLTLRAIADNEKVIIGKMTRADSDIGGGNVSEILTLIISLKTLETFAGYSTLEMQVGSDEFAFDGTQIEQFKLFTDKLKSLMPTKPVAPKRTKRRS